MKDNDFLVFCSDSDAIEILELAGVEIHNGIITIPNDSMPVIVCRAINYLCNDYDYSTEKEDK